MSKSHVAILVLAVAFALPGCVDSRQPGTLAKTQAADRTILQVKEDLARGRRWELGWGTLDVYDIATDELVHVVSLEGANLSGAREVAPPDMVLTRFGAVIVSSNAQPSIWRISPSSFEVERFDLEVDSDHDKDFGFTALTWSAGERELFGVSTATGSLWRIDLATSKAVLL